MAAQDGVDMILKYNTTSATYAAIGGEREVTLTLNHEQVDVTSKDSESTANNTLYRELLDGAGVQTCSVSGSFVFDDTSAANLIRNDYQSRTAASYRLIVPGSNLDNIQGNFQVSSFEMAGVYNDAVTMNLTLESAGDISFTTAA